VEFIVALVIIIRIYSVYTDYSGRIYIKYYLPPPIALASEYVFARLEHISYLLKSYIEKQHTVPEGDYSLTQLLSILRSESEVLLDRNGYESFLSFLHSDGMVDGTDPLLMKMLLPKVSETLWRRHQLGDDKYHGDGYIDKYIIVRDINSPNQLYFGIQMINFMPRLGRDRITCVYPKVLASIRNGYYYSNVLGVQYDGSNTIFIKLKMH
jgi:hypothetical protein